MNCECPNCGYEDAYFDAGRGSYYCPNCNRYFSKVHYSIKFRQLSAASSVRKFLRT